MHNIEMNKENEVNTEQEGFFEPIFMSVTETIADTAPYPQNSQNSQNSQNEWEEIIPLSSGGSGNDGKELPKIDPICIPPAKRTFSGRNYALECAKFYQTAPRKSS